MRAVVYHLAILVFLLAPIEMAAGKRAGISSNPDQLEETDLRVLFNNVLIYQKEGGVISGLMVGIESDALIIRREGTDQKIPRKNLSKVIIDLDSNTGSTALTTMLLTTYLSNLIALRVKDQPTAYMENASGWGIAIGNVLFAAAGGGIGVLLGSLTKSKEKSFDFSGEHDNSTAVWEDMRSFIIGADSHPKKIHVSIHAGRVFPKTADRYFSLFNDKGMFTRWTKKTNRFNLLRKFQITYSLHSKVEVGLAMLWLGEPSIRASSGGNYGYYEVTLSNITKGIYVVTAINPFATRTTGDIALKIGIGLGAVNTRIDLQERNHQGSKLSHSGLNKTGISGLLFSEFEIPVTADLSFGFLADYALIPEQDLPDIPAAGITSEKRSVRNGSIGFKLAFHF